MATPRDIRRRMGERSCGIKFAPYFCVAAVVVFLSFAHPASAGLVSYKLTAELNADSPLGAAGSLVTGYFSYRTDLRLRFQTSEMANYQFIDEETYPDPGVYAQLHFQNDSVYTPSEPRGYPSLSIYNDWGLNTPGAVVSDIFVISASRPISTTGLWPFAASVGIYLRDTDYSVFDSFDIPATLPSLGELEITNAGEVISFSPPWSSTITSLVRLNNGDLDGDGFVGVADLNIVLGKWNQQVIRGDRLAGDVSGDTFVGIEDLNYVLGNWNVGTPPIDHQNIPEPTTSALLGVFGWVVLRRG